MKPTLLLDSSFKTVIFIAVCSDSINVTACSDPDQVWVLVMLIVHTVQMLHSWIALVTSKLHRSTYL